MPAHEPGIDTFSDSLHLAINKYDHISYWEVVGRTGIGARFTLSMNTKKNNDIGHPSSIYIWDIVSTASHCFDFINWHLYVGKGYMSRARDTAAQTSQELNNYVTVVSNPMELEGPLIYVNDSGKWEYADHIFLKMNESLPFGPVALQVTGFEPQPLVFPRSMLGYLIRTLERGEEPMEIEGKHGLSAVSGWKAYARWMQSLSIPLRNMRNPYQKQLAIELLQRRTNFVRYLEELLKVIDGREETLISQLHQDYQAVLEPAKQVTQEINLENVRKLYYTEQRTLPTYKSIRNYLKS